MMNNLFKQRRIKFLGEFIDSVFTAMPVLSAYGVVSTSIILYEVTKQYILNWVPWMNIIYFIFILGGLFAPIILLVFKFVIPSVWHFRSTQMSHLEEKIDAIAEKLDKFIEGHNENSSGK